MKKINFTIIHIVYLVFWSSFLLISTDGDLRVLGIIGIALFIFMFGIFLKDVFPMTISNHNEIFGSVKSCDKIHFIFMMKTISIISSVLLAISVLIASIGTLDFYLIKSNANFQSIIVMWMVVPIWLCARKGSSKVINILENK